MPLTLRLGLWNMVGLTGIRGGVDYGLFPGRFFLGTPRRVKRAVLDNLQRFIAEEKPDIVFLSEIQDDPDLRDVMRPYEHFRIDSKYMGKGLLGRLPFMGTRDCNGFFAKRAYEHRIHELSTGTKKLLYIIDVSQDTCLILGHFALTKNARSAQFEEVARLCDGKRIIVAGDLNLFGGAGELESLMAARGLRLCASAPTFPTSDPRYTIDLVVASSDIDARSRVRTDVCVSDHLPVVCDLML